MERSGRRWVRGSCVGRGANGTVSLALNLSNGEVFAVKSVELCSASSSQIRALENEIEILRSLSSPYVVGYLGDDEMAMRRNLHLEYVPGGTSADLAVFDEGAVRSYTWCLVSALSYLHGRGIVHCDVKGKNVLLGSTPGSAKLADFGSAARISEGKISPRGSPLWMAPEVVRGEYQGPESDVWSLGCTVIEMVTGKPKWGSVNWLRRSSEMPEFPPKLSESGCDFLRRCLKTEVGERWTCDQLLQHPFIRNCSPPEEEIFEASPRCVLDFFDRDFGEEGSGTTEEDDGDLNMKAKRRIEGLLSGEGAKWETEDGWVAVRDDVEEAERTSWEYLDLGGANEEISRRGTEYSGTGLSGSDSGEAGNSSQDDVVSMGIMLLFLMFFCVVKRALFMTYYSWNSRIFTFYYSWILFYFGLNYFKKIKKIF